MLAVSRLTIFAVTLLLADCAAAPSSDSKEACPFVYNQSVIDRLVIPKLKAVYGDNYTMYDLKKPGIVDRGQSVQLVFGQSRIDVLDTPDFIVEIDRCSRKVTRAYETSPFPTDAPKR
jgi:hypothetical protein